MADGITQPGTGATEASDEPINKLEEEAIEKTQQQLVLPRMSLRFPRQLSGLRAF